MMNNIFTINLLEDRPYVRLLSIKIPGDKNGNLLLYGRGLNSYLLYRHVRCVGSLPKHPFDETNVVCLSPGYLSGTKFPSSGRTTVSVLKSPVTGLFADGNFGGYFGYYLRLCGVRGLFIIGIAQKLSYIIVRCDGSVSIERCEELQSTTNSVCTRRLREKHGNVKVLSVGPAGERGIFCSVVNCDNRVAGGGGTGAVLGRKNIKAIVVEQPNYYLYPKRFSKFENICKVVENRIKNHPVYSMFSKYGTTSLMELHAGMKYLPSFNFTKKVFSKWGNISGKKLRKLLLKDYPNLDDVEKKLIDAKELGCVNCPIVCSNVEKIEYETLNCLGSKLGISDLNFIRKINKYYMNGCGLDVIQSTSVIATLMQLYDKGFLNGLYTIKWGHQGAVETFLSNFVFGSFGIPLFFRNGIIHGIKLLVVKGIISPENKEKALECFVGVKGNALSGVYPSSSNKGVALAIATSSRGADHLRSLPTLATYADWYFRNKGILPKLKKLLTIPVSSLFMMKSELKVLLSEDLYKSYTELFGVPKEIVDKWKKSNFLFNNSYDGWELMIKFTQEIYAVSDILGICRFITPWRFGIGPELLAETVFYFSGKRISWKCLMRSGEFTYAIERWLLSKYGVIDDSLPKRFCKNDKDGIDGVEFKKLLQKYYKLCEYNEEGSPSVDFIESFE